MFKTRFIIITILMLMVLVINVSAEGLQNIFIANSTVVTKVSTKPIPVDKPTIQEVQISELSEDLTEQIQSFKNQPGYILFQSTENEFILVVYAGEKRTGGYGISVESLNVKDGVTHVVVKETSPGKDDFVTMAFTYPFAVVKLTGVSSNFNVKTTNKMQLNILSTIVKIDPTPTRKNLVTFDQFRIETLKIITNAWNERLDQLFEQLNNTNTTELQKKIIQTEQNYVLDQLNKYQTELDSLLLQLNSNI